VSIKELSDVLSNKFNIKKTNSLLVSRYLIEEKKNEGKIAFSEFSSIKRSDLKQKLNTLFGNYYIYNGLSLTHLLNRI
jgi:hypothetical protein